MNTINILDNDTSIAFSGIMLFLLGIILTSTLILWMMVALTKTVKAQDAYIYESTAAAVLVVFLAMVAWWAGVLEPALHPVMAGGVLTSVFAVGALIVALIKNIRTCEANSSETQ